MCSGVRDLIKLYSLCVVVIIGFLVYNRKLYPKSAEKWTRFQLGYGCILPSHPKSGWWLVMNEKGTFSSGTLMSHATVLQIYCEETYKIEGCKMVVCMNGTWVPEIGTCLKTCSSIPSTSKMKVKCMYNDNLMRTCTEPFEGTMAEITCAPFYEDTRCRRFNSYCIDGKWSVDTPDCVPICGLKAPKRNPTLIINGTEAPHGEFRWQVAIYRVKEKLLICGGSLLSERVVLTAAHCIVSDKGRLYSKENLMVAVGNYYRNYNDSRDSTAQFSFIHAMFVPSDYEGEAKDFSGDIGIIVTENPFTLTASVQPVCLHHSHTQHSSPEGYVSGWGHTKESKDPSEVLRYLKVPIIERKLCEDMVPDDYKKYVTSDKFCAGFLGKGTSVCRGDSGGGLVWQKDADSRYYIMGVVSSAPLANSSEGGCDSQQYAFYTRVGFYLNSFILEKIARFKVTHFPIDDNTKSIQKTTTVNITPLLVKSIPIPKHGCILPKHPKFGQWDVIFGNTSTTPFPGMPVNSKTLLKVQCSENHKLLGSNILLCENTTWSSPIGKCRKICPSRYSSSKMTVTCSYKGVNMEDCIEPVDGTMASYKCNAFYQDERRDGQPIYCINGNWIESEPRCVPICGEKSMDPRLSDTNESAMLRGHYPWLVGIYENNSKKLICSGSLLSERVVLTAAHCLMDASQTLLPNENFIVAAGKYYRQYNDTRDDQKAQISTIENIILDKENNANTRERDTALIIVKEMFTFSIRIKPVCLNFEQNFFNMLENPDTIVGAWGNVTSLFIPNDTNSPELSESDMYKSDKVCAIFCKNDTSLYSTYELDGGLFHRDKGRYYIIGVLSYIVVNNSTGKTGCEVQYNGFYTQIDDNNKMFKSSTLANHNIF